MVVEKKICKYKLAEQPKESVYWHTKSYQERIDALEEVRREYNLWRYNAEQRLQRVYHIIKQT